MKRCKHCGELKPYEDFYRDRYAKDGCRPECKACNSAARKAKYAENPAPYIARVKRWQQENSERLNAYRRGYRQRPERKAADRDGHLRRKYGIGLDEYERMLDAQGGVCAICQEARPDERTLHVDHVHETGEIRGLLCFRCNNALGDMRDSADFARALLDYLDRDDELAALARERVEALII